MSFMPHVCLFVVAHHLTLAVIFDPSESTLVAKTYDVILWNKVHLLKLCTDEGYVRDRVKMTRGHAVGHSIQYQSRLIDRSSQDTIIDPRSRQMYTCTIN